MKLKPLVTAIAAGLCLPIAIAFVEMARGERLRMRLLDPSPASRAEALMEIYREDKRLSDELLRVVAADLGTSDALVRESAEAILWKAKPRLDAFREALPAPQTGDPDLGRRVDRLLH